jgi:hypothetical protein
VDAEKSKELEIKLRKMFGLNKHSQSAKEQPQVKFDIGNVIRRRKGEQDKRIFRMPKNYDFKI